MIKPAATWFLCPVRNLLRYTDVMQRGYTSMPTFSSFVRQAWGRSPSARRRGDIGKYAL
ncbi:MAG: hypothetical protein IKH86_09290 [Prevotella sp.]|nr:hypothetical protein [Prevotella sp.]